MKTRILESLSAAEPPRELSRPLQALWWLRKGELMTGSAWDRAHGICQMGEGNRELDRIHALAHWIECDMGNADYWYRRAGTRRAGASVAEEWERIVTDLEDGPGTA